MLFRHLLSMLALVSIPAFAAELPRSGNDDYTVTYVNTSTTVMKLPDGRTLSTFEINGIMRNDSGGQMFSNMGSHCIGLREATGTDVTSRGSCVDMDTEGDQIISNFEYKAPKGVHTFVGGTGKYVGMTGTADYTTTPMKAPDGRGMFMVNHKSNWKLPSETAASK